MKYYTIAKKVAQTYGHGSFGDELHICPKGAYGTEGWFPLFESRNDAENYMVGQKVYSSWKVVELEVYS